MIESMQKPYRMRNRAILLTTVFLMPFFQVDSSEAGSTAFYNTSPFTADNLILPQKKDSKKPQNAPTQEAKNAQNTLPAEHDAEPHDALSFDTFIADEIADEAELEAMFTPSTSAQITSTATDKTKENNSNMLSRTALPTRNWDSTGKQVATQQINRDTKLGKSIEKWASDVGKFFSDDDKAHATDKANTATPKPTQAAQDIKHTAATAKTSTSPAQVATITATPTQASTPSQSDNNAIKTETKKATLFDKIGNIFADNDDTDKTKPHNETTEHAAKQTQTTAPMPVNSTIENNKTTENKQTDENINKNKDLAQLAPAAGHAPQSPTPVLLEEQKILKDSQAALPPATAKNIATTTAKPIATMNEAATASNEGQNLDDLSLVSRSILESLPSELTGLRQSKEPWKEFNINREKQGIDLPALDDSDGKSATNASQRRGNGYDAGYELERAYNALMAGETEQAVTIYKDVLSNAPDNETALFGLATTYHRLGQMEKAAILYGHILMKNPYNLETLNNFLALVGEESPEIAAEQMERLAAHNPEFSPIYAQLAALYTRLDKLPLAVDRMSMAVGISPDNLTYKYNLAVLYDQAGDKTNAIRIYRQLLRSSQMGQALPTNVKSIQERLTFLSSN